MENDDGKYEFVLNKYREQILELINNNDVTIISSSTGSGKTSQVPIIIHDEIKKKGDEKVSIVITQPRRLATRTIAEHVAKQMKVNVGEGVVGYMIMGENKTTTDTSITFMTTGTLVEILSISKIECGYTHILLDEIHGKDIYTDEVLLQLKILQLENPYWRPKIVLLSATITVQTFKDYFSHVKVDALEINSDDRMYPITNYYIDDLESGKDGLLVQGLRNFYPTRDSKTNPNYGKVKDLILQLDKLDVDGQKGGVLIFLPGIGEINQMGQKLNSYDKFKRTWEIIEMHSNVSTEDQYKARKDGSKNRRKIIISTNLMESSLTIIDIRYVIDFCLTKYMMSDPETGFSGLSTTLCSHQQADQRSGRVGRVSPGVSFRIVTKHFYETEMKKESLAEMQNCGLELSFLHLKRLNIGSPFDLFQKAINPPELKNIETAVKNLKECGALSIISKDGTVSEYDGELTIIGLLASSLSCDPRQARLICFSYLFGFLKEGVVMAMSLTAKSLFASFMSQDFEDVEKGVNAWMHRIELGGRMKCDLLANLGAYNYYFECKTRNINQWMEPLRQKNIKSAVLRNVQYSVDRIHRKLGSYFKIYSCKELLTVEEILDDPTTLIRIQILLAAASYPNIFLHAPSCMHADHEEEVGKLLIGFDPMKSFYFKPALPYSEKPNTKQLNELLEQITFGNLNPSIKTQAIWSAGLIAVEYEPEDANWGGVGQVAKEVLQGLKYKGMNHSFHWTIDKDETQIHRPQYDKMCLRGPDSPLLMKFKSFFGVVHGHEIAVDRESVNLYPLDEAFPRPLPYVLASMQLTKPKLTLVAKDSTILPPLPGLFTFLHLIFSPRFQFCPISKDKDGVIEGYRGGMAGLGSTEDGNAVYENHDSNIIFDVIVKPADIVFVNSIRRDLDQLMRVDSFKSMNLLINARRKQCFNKIVSFLDKEREMNNEECYYEKELEKIYWEPNTVGSVVEELFPPHKTPTES